MNKDYEYYEHAYQDAEDLTNETGRLHIAIDRGASVYPRYDVIEAPKVGDKVSRAFNGDYYPEGEIVSVSKTLKKVTTSTGKSFYRKRLTGAWINNGTWMMVRGHIDERNPHF